MPLTRRVGAAVLLAVAALAAEMLVSPNDIPYGLKLYSQRPNRFDPPVDDEKPINPWSRSLQAAGCAPPAINRGSWSGLTPDMDSVCGYFWWTGSFGQARTVYSSPATWTLTCGSGYYLVGSATYQCTGAKTCQYDPAQGYSGSCSNVCNYQNSGGNCIYCCKCTNAWTFNTVTSSCAQCIPPAAANAINPATIDGAYQYTWSCQLGYYAQPVTRSCSSTGGGTWSGTAIACTLCPTPASPTNGFLTRPSTPDIWQFQCNPGFYNAAGASVTQLRCLPDSASYATTGIRITTCSACSSFGAGYFCTGTAAPQQCAAGYFGLPGVSYSASTCGGSCTAGYFCPLGSTSSTAFQCGNAAVYCPAGSGQPVPVSANHYTTPTTGSPALRTGQLQCPAFRSCTNGLIDPPVVIDPNVCVNGRVTGAAVQEFFSFSPFVNGIIPVTTPGYTGNVFWRVDSVSPANPTNCKIDSSFFAFSGGTLGGTSTTITTSSKALNYGNCSDGFTIAFSVVRSNDNSLSASCQAFVEVLQVARPPVVTDCNSRSVNERSLLGTAVGTALGATNPNVGTSLLWYINTTTTGPVPFSIGMCDGQIRVLKTILYSQSPVYFLNITIRNDGSSINIGSVSVSCNVRVNITQIPVPPVITTTAFYVPELVPVGTLVGNLGVFDPSNFTIKSIIFGSIDTPNIFRVNSTTGDIFTTGVPDSLQMQKAVWNYGVNATNAINTMTSSPIAINIVPVPRPPTTFDQQRIIAENIRNGSTLPPQLFASHPQGMNMTFQLSPNSVFDCFPNGTVYLRQGPLDYYVQRTYALAIIVTDTNGRTATATLTISLTAVPRPPFWSLGTSVFSYSVQELAAYRQALTRTGNADISASNIDPQVTIVYRVLSSSPAAGNGLFAIDPFTAAVTVGPNINLATGFLFDPALSYPQPQTFVMQIAAVDGNGLSVNGTVFIQVVNIQPRITLPPAITSGGFVLSANQLTTAGSLVANISAFTWSPYPTTGPNGTAFVFSLSADPTAEGDATFVINPATGIVSLANVSYTTGGNGTLNATGDGGVTVFGAPRWNYNTRNIFECNVTVSQGALQRTLTFRVNLPHTNRPPVFTRFPTLFAPAGSPGTVGAALFPSVVYDPDALLSFVGENFTFSILSGNTDNTFNISAATGQIQVADPFAAAFQFQPGGRNSFNLTISVTDAGVNGPRYTAVGWVQMNMTNANFAPAVSFHNFSIPEHKPVGTLVGILNATDRNIGQKLRYSLEPRGRNVNKPFPFNVTTSYAAQYRNVQGVGVVTVANDPTDLLNLGLDFNEAFQLYYATVTVTDDDPVAPLSSTANVEIHVTWVAEPPYFRVASIRFTPPEHMPAGYPIGTIVGWSKDPWQRPALTYAWSSVTPAATRALFNLASNGNVTLSATAGDLAVISQASYTLTVVVTDTNSLRGNTTVTIALQDVPEPARFVGLFNAANTASVGGSMSLQESAAIGTTVGFLRVTDDDAVTSPLSGWGATYFQLVPNADSGYFSVDPQTGAIRTAAGLDFWDQTSFSLNVSVADGLTVYQSIAFFTVPVALVQVNTVAVTSFFVEPGVLPSVAINDSTGARFTTSGLALPQLYIVGRNLGPTQRRMTRESIPLAATVVTARFGPAWRYSTACSVVVPNTVLRCPVPPGVGTGHVWNVTVNNQWSAISSASTGYYAPTISSVYRVGGTVGLPATQTITTRGTDAIEITGINMGPVGTLVTMGFGRQSRAAGVYEYTPVTRLSCTMVTAHTVVRCPTAQGIGRDLRFVVEVSGQFSPDFTSSPVIFTPPAITRVSAPTLATSGGQAGAIIINGTNFGPFYGIGIDISAAYSVNFGSPFFSQFVARNCRVDSTSPHTAAICDSVPGVGRNLALRVTIGNQTSVSSSDTVTYASPVVTSINGPGVHRALTTGGQDVTIVGSSFGPVTPLFPNGTAMPGDLQPVGFYGPNGTTTRYTAANCRVVNADTVIICSTVEGVGYGLLWSVAVGAQRSPIFTGETSDYHPPIVASYSGPGAEDAETWGGETVIITGANFGPLGTSIDLATYGNDDNGTQFISPNCTLTTAHSVLACATNVGAGAGLKWFVTIGDQRSVTPTTAYGAPVIYDFSGIGAVNASTDGGDRVTINGHFFSIDQYLDYVTYGPNGVEYKATGCSLSVNHTQLTCTLRPGVGRNLKWYVSVGSQLSRLSSNFTSYAVPRISWVSRLNATTAGREPGTNFPVSIVVDGWDFALNYLLAQPVIRINNLNSPRPSQAAMDEHWYSVYSGGSGRQDVQLWIDSLTALSPYNLRTMGRSRHSVTVNIPEGFGAGCELFLVSGGIPSNVLNFTYLPPVITNVAPDRQNTTSPTQLRVFIEGTSFCNGQYGCGRVLIDGNETAVTSWSHNSILFYVDTGGVEAYVQVEVGGVRSNRVKLDRPVPNINALVTQNAYLNMDTRGGEEFIVRGVLDVGGINDTVTILIGNRPCANAWGYVDNGRAPNDKDVSYTMHCTTPPGVGSNLDIRLQYMNSTSAESVMRFSYGAPLIQTAQVLLPIYDNDTQAAVRTGAMQLPPLASAVAIVNGVPTKGAVIVLNGLNFGTAALSVASLVDNLGGSTVTVLYQNHTRVIALVDEGDGTNHALMYTVGMQVSNIVPFTYAAPSVLRLEPDHGPTLGGSLIRIVGLNFGLSLPTVLFGSRPCNVTMPYATSANHSIIECVSPAGQGRAIRVRVTVAGQDSLLPGATWNFDPPEIGSIFPASGPTSGKSLGPFDYDGVHRLPGPRIMQTILGHNFGTYGRVSFLPGPRSDALSQGQNFTVPNTDILFWNDSMVSFFMPEGFGANLLVSVFADQESASNVEFSYDAPRIDAIIRYDRTVAQCQDYEVCFSYGNDTRCRIQPAGCYDTRGGYPLELVGQSFGKQSFLRTFTQIFVGGKPCVMPTDVPTVAALSHSRLVCLAPSGLGESLPVTVALGQRASTWTNASSFNYDPPMVSLISPNTPDATGKQTLQIRGKNFGSDPTPLMIRINDEACTSQEWLNDAQLKCQPPAQVVGAKNISILVANRTQPYTFYDLEEQVIYQCAKDYYGLEGEVCLECPQGARCPGAERRDDLVNATDGFWRFNYTIDTDDAVMFCDAPRRDTREVCPAFLPCGPPEACLEGNICAEGYEGERCAYCLKGKYYRQNDICVKCPSNLPVLYAGLAVMFMLITAFAWFLNKRNVSLALIAVGVDWAQVMSMFARTKIRWPALLRQLFQILSAFNLNLEITAPECLNPGIQFWQKWFFIESVPLAVAAILAMVYFARYAYKGFVLKHKKAQRGDHLAMQVSTFIVLFRVLYLYVTKTSFDVLNCTPTDPPTFRDSINKKGSIEFMSGLTQPEYECWAKNSWQVFLFPFGVGTLVTYTFVVPGLALWKLRRSTFEIAYDQILRAKGTGDDRLTNPHFDFRQMWQKLYYHYRPDKWYWEFCITARKMAIAGTSLAFRQIPSYQLAIALLVLFTAYVLHVLHWPYLSHTTTAGVIEEHEQRAAYDKVHIQIEQDMQEMAKRNQRKRQKANIFDSRSAKKSLGGNTVVLTLFDSNTVESVLLGSCVLVSLAGIMLDSKRFDGDNWYIPQVQREYTGLTFGALMCIVFSIVYYSTVFTVEMCLIFCPDVVPHLLVCCKNRAAEADLKKNARKMASINAEHDSGIMVNPILLKQDEAAFADARDNILGESGILDANQLMKIQTPSPAMWQAVQGSYSRLMNMTLSLREQVRQAKHETERVVSTAHDELTAPAARPKRRMQFGPITKDSEASDDGPSSARAPTSPGNKKLANGVVGFKSAALKGVKTPRALLVGAAGESSSSSDSDDGKASSSSTSGGVGGGGAKKALNLAAQRRAAAQRRPSSFGGTFVPASMAAALANPMNQQSLGLVASAAADDDDAADGVDTAPIVIVPAADAGPNPDGKPPVAAGGSDDSTSGVAVANPMRAE